MFSLGADDSKTDGRHLTPVGAHLGPVGLDACPLCGQAAGCREICKKQMAKRRRLMNQRFLYLSLII